MTRQTKLGTGSENHQLNRKLHQYNKVSLVNSKNWWLSLRLSNNYPGIRLLKITWIILIIIKKTFWAEATRRRQKETPSKLILTKKLKFHGLKICSNNQISKNQNMKNIVTTMMKKTVKKIQKTRALILRTTWLMINRIYW